MKPDWQALAPTEFERLCYDTLMALGFSNVSWRAGSGDRGRDIECVRYVAEPDGSSRRERWFVECKHETRPLSVDRLYPKLAWADAEEPDYLLIMTSSRVSPQAQDWLERMTHRRRYRIRVWDTDTFERIAAENPAARQFLEAALGKRSMLSVAKAKYQSTKTPLTCQDIRALLDEQRLADIPKELLDFALHSLSLSQDDGASELWTDVFRAWCMADDYESLVALVNDVSLPPHHLGASLKSDGDSARIADACIKSFLCRPRLSHYLQLGSALVFCETLSREPRDVVPGLISRLHELRNGWAAADEEAIGYGAGRLAALAGDEDIDRWLAAFGQLDDSSSSHEWFFFLGLLVGVASPDQAFLAASIQSGEDSQVLIYKTGAAVDAAIAHRFHQFASETAISDGALLSALLRAVSRVRTHHARVAITRLMEARWQDCCRLSPGNFLEALEAIAPHHVGTALQRMLSLDDKTRAAVMRYLRRWNKSALVLRSLSDVTVDALVGDSDEVVLMRLLEAAIESTIRLPQAALLRLIHDPRSAVAARAIMVAGVTNREELRPLIPRLMKHDSGEVRQALAFALGRMMFDGWESYVLRLLGDKAAGVRLQAALELKHAVPTREILTRLAALVSDGSGDSYWEWRRWDDLGHVLGGTVGDAAEKSLLLLQGRLGSGS